jgi:GH24 family phage-related lysozyme (muramidase)
MVRTMRASVAEAFPEFTKDLEGGLNYLYLDKLGFPTTGYGNLVNTQTSVCALPWKRPDGSLATRDEIIAEWATIRALIGQRNPHGVLWTDCGGVIFAQFTTIRLDADGVAGLVRRTIEADEDAMKRRYSDWETWPACAQMACMSLAWACGANYDFPKMDRALANRDFAEASREIDMTAMHNPGNDLRRRNHANETLMLNASRVESFDLDPDLLDWTNEIDVSGEITQPSIPENAASSPTICAPPPEAVVHADPQMCRLDSEPNEPDAS